MILLDTVPYTHYLTVIRKTRVQSSWSHASTNTHAYTDTKWHSTKIKGVIVYSGFDHKARHKGSGDNSGRPVRSSALRPILQENRHESKHLENKIRDFYKQKNQLFPHFIYECTMFSPALADGLLAATAATNFLFITLMSTHFCSDEMHLFTKVQEAFSPERWQAKKKGNSKALEVYSL